MTSYKIRWHERNGIGHSETVDMLSTNYTVDGLQPCVLYTFSVAAITKAGEGASASVNGTTKLEGTALLYSFHDVNCNDIYVG